MRPDVRHLPLDCRMPRDALSFLRGVRKDKFHPKVAVISGFDIRLFIIAQVKEPAHDRPGSPDEIA